MNAEEVIAELQAGVLRHGSQKELAARIGVSRSYLCDVLAGKREPTGPILEHLGLERRVGYEPKPRAAKRAAK